MAEVARCLRCGPVVELLDVCEKAGTIEEAMCKLNSRFKRRVLLLCEQFNTLSRKHLGSTVIELLHIYIRPRARQHLFFLGAVCPALKCLKLYHVPPSCVKKFVGRNVCATKV